MTTSVPLDNLGGWLRDEITRADTGETVVLAGHFALFSAGGHAADLLDAPAPPPSAAEMVAFTKHTWNAACTAISHGTDGAARGARLLILADDVMFVRPLAGTPRVRERLGDALASHYLGATPALPAFHARTLAAAGLGEAHIFRQSAERWIFSERELRVAHVRRLKSLLAAGTAGTQLSANADQTEITVTTGEHGAHCLVQSGHTNCAGGYLELLATLHAAGVRTLIALVPARCLGPIATGASLAQGLFALRALHVVNVAVPDIHSGLPASVLREPRT